MKEREDLFFSFSYSLSIVLFIHWVTLLITSSNVKLTAYLALAFNESLLIRITNYLYYFINFLSNSKFFSVFKKFRLVINLLNIKINCFKECFTIEIITILGFFQYFLTQNTVFFQSSISSKSYGIYKWQNAQTQKYFFIFSAQTQKYFLSMMAQYCKRL